MFINHSSKEVTAKIVFYGPGLSGKTTCLQYIFSVTNPNTRGELISIETEIERTLFFDLLPVNVGLVKGYQTKFQLYTVPGQVFYDSTRKLVLKGADGIVFVADSQKIMEQPNLASMENLKINLASHKLDISEIPLVFQYNKRDLTNVFSIEELNKILNPQDLPFFGSIATSGKGVIEVLRVISSLILGKIKHLLDQTEEELAAMPVVDFATNKKYKIIDKEKLPFKKIQTDNFDAANQRMNPKNTEPQEELKVETGRDFNDLEDITFNQEPMELEPMIDMEAFKIDGLANEDREIKKTHTPKKETENINVPNIPEFDGFNDEEEEDDLLGKTVVEADFDISEFAEMGRIVKDEIKKEKEIEPPEKEEIDIVLEQEPFTGLQDIPLGMDDEPVPAKITWGEPLDEENEEIEELEDIGELVTEGNVKKTVQTQKSEKKPDDIKDAEPFALGEEINLDINETPFQELEEVKEIEQEAPFTGLEDVKETRKIKEVKKIEKPGTTKPLKEIKKIPILPNAMELFEQFKDKTRLTLIKGVPVKGPDAQLLIDIKDGDSNLLESLKIKITPEIKKVTLILDVKK